MSQSTRFEIGDQVSCSDGVCGELRRVVIDPVARTITHLVVEPRGSRGQARLVAIERVVSADNGIALACTEAEFRDFEEAQETQLMRRSAGDLGYHESQVLSWPYYGLHTGGIGVVSGGSGLTMRWSGADLVTHDRVPLGGVEVRRGEHVHATDGPIGRVKGLVIDPRDHHVTHFLLDEGHLWGEKTVAIPISAVTRVGDGVRLSLSRDEVRDLPPVAVDDLD